jgi:hypothetical protein
MALFRIDYQGTLQGIESFQHGHHVSSADSAIGVAGDAAAAWSTFLGTAAVNTFYNTGVVWAQVNVSELGATPSAPIVTSAQANIALGGLSSDLALPPQCSPCVSLTTATAGSRARGRMFLPSPDITSIVFAGRLTSGFRTAVITGLDTYFATMTINGHDTVVVSAVGGVYTTYEVVTIRLGDVVDTQRSRRNDIAEVYTTASI